MKSGRTPWHEALVLLVAVAIAMPIVAQQQKVPLTNRVEQADILNTGHSTGKIAKAPNLMEFYFDERPESEWIPDEFMSNADRRVDAANLRGYHISPQIMEMELLTPKQVKIGDTVKVRILIRSRVPVNPNSMMYEGIDGRDTRMTLRMARALSTEERDDGMLWETWEAVGTVPEWNPGGTYFPLAIQNLNNQLGHGKSFRSDYHPVMDRNSLSFEVEDNPNYDLTPPALTKFVLGSLDGSRPQQPLQAKITDLIPVYAEVEDAGSGVDEVTVTLASPERNLYSDIVLSPLLDQENHPNAMVGYFRLNPYYEGGEYRVARIRLRDRARNQRTAFPNSNEALGEQRISIIADREDLTPPQLITLSIDKRSAQPGEGVTLRAVITDNLSGVDNITVTIHSPNSIDKRRVSLTPKAKPDVLIKPAYDVQENIYEGTFTTHPLDEPGWWTVKRVIARDLANNYMDMISRDYVEIETVQVLFSESDLEDGAFGNTGYTDRVRRSGSGTVPTLRRTDMIPPHPPRGACLNCHVP